MRVAYQIGFRIDLDAVAAAKPGFVVVLVNSEIDSGTATAEIGEILDEALRLGHVPGNDALMQSLKVVAGFAVPFHLLLQYPHNFLLEK